MKTAELEDGLLNYWVAKAEGWNFFWSKHNHWVVTKPNGTRYTACEGWAQFDSDTGAENHRPHPSEALENFYPASHWEDGGPIIDRDRISTRADEYQKDLWYAEMIPLPDNPLWPARFDSKGRTALEAAMRAKVASKYGDDVPDKVN